MIRRRYIIGLVVVSALAVSAATAGGALAEQRAYTCSSGATTKQFTDAHCLNKAEPKEFGHSLVPVGEEVEFTVTNARTISATAAAAPTKFKITLGGKFLEVICTGLSGTGSLTNAVGSATLRPVLTYSGCSVTMPAGKGCLVKGGSISSNELVVTTVGQSAGKLKFTAASGGVLWTMTIEGCGYAASYPVSGNFVADISGATVTTTHTEITIQNTLLVGGIKFGLEGPMTLGTSGGALTFT